MLDVSDKVNYKWVIKFTPVSPMSIPSAPTDNTTDTSPVSPVSPQSPKNLGAIIGGTIGGIVVVVVSIFLLYHRNSKNKAIPTPGDR